MKVPQQRAGSLSRIRSLLICAMATFCTAAFVSTAFAQSVKEAPKDTPKPATKAEPKEKAPTTPPATTQPAPKPASKSPKKSGCGGADDNTPAVVKPAAPGTTPKFVCKDSTVELKPVWKGDPLVFEFNVSNEGDADLSLKIKGG